MRDGSGVIEIASTLAGSGRSSPKPDVHQHFVLLDTETKMFVKSPSIIFAGEDGVTLKQVDLRNGSKAAHLMAVICST